MSACVVEKGTSVCMGHLPAGMEVGYMENGNIVWVDAWDTTYIHAYGPCTSVYGNSNRRPYVLPNIETHMGRVSL